MGFWPDANLLYLLTDLCTASRVHACTECMQLERHVVPPHLLFVQRARCLAEIALCLFVGKAQAFRPSGSTSEI